MTPPTPARPNPRMHSPFLRPLALTAVAFALAACGGGGGGSDPLPPPGPGPGPVTAQSISGKVVDGYIAGATVSCRNAGALVAQTTSDASGNFAFNLPAGKSCDTVESIGGIDIGLSPDDPSDDVLAPAGVFSAPVPTGSATVTNRIVSPLTTLVQALVAGGATPDAAQAKVKTSLGLPAALDLLGTDPAGDAALYKANAVVTQVIGQITDALAAASGIDDALGLQALAGAAFDAVAAKLSTLTMAGLTPAPDALTPGSPLFGLVEQAATNAKANAQVAGALQNLNPTTFAALASPLVASATGSVNAATSTNDVIARAREIDDRDRATGVLDALKDLTDNTAADPQAVLDQMAAALAAADTGSDAPLSVTIGSQTAIATVAGGLSNYARLVDDEVTLHGPSSSTTVTLADFESTAGVDVPQELVRIGFALQKSTVNSQLSSMPMEAPLALEVSGGTRAFQAIIDRVSLTADGTGKVVASLPTGAKLWVYGKTLTTETTSPLVVTLAGTGLQIVTTTGGTISYSLDRLFEAIGAAAAPGSALDVLAQNRVSDGTYDVTMALGTLRVARSTSASDPAPVLAALRAVTLRAGSQSVTGYSFKGKATVTP